MAGKRNLLRIALRSRSVKKKTEPGQQSPAERNKMKKDWEEIEKFFKLLERDETLDKQLKETTGSEEYFLIILESLSPLHTLEISKEKERKEELKKLYDLCSFDEELDKELGTMAGIDGGYLTTALEKIIK